MSIIGGDLRPSGMEGGTEAAMIPGVKERVMAFDASHGAWVQDGAWLHFEDGACREVNPLGLLSAPPSDPYKLWNRILRYHEIRLAAAVLAFEDRKKYLVQSAKAHLGEQVMVGAAVANADAAEAELKKLQAEAQKCKRAVDAARTQRDAVEPDGLKRRRQRNEENREANQELLARITGIEI
jgi:hypothetical protein